MGHAVDGSAAAHARHGYTHLWYHKNLALMYKQMIVGSGHQTVSDKAVRALAYRHNMKCQAVCPGNHVLKKFETPHGRFNCDECRKRELPSGSKMFGCRTCDYALCLACH